MGRGVVRLQNAATRRIHTARLLNDEVGGVAESLAAELGLRVRVHKGGQIRKQILQVIMLVI